MGLIFRFPLFLLGCMFWIPAGLILSLFQWCFLPLTLMLTALSPRNFSGAAGAVVSFASYRRGFHVLAYFLRNGL